MQCGEIRSTIGTMHPVTEIPVAIEFGRFRVLPHRRELLADNLPVELGGRAFEVLMALIEAQGAVVSKDALTKRVWPNQFVEENNLPMRISTLRKVFGADRELIRTVFGRGYQFGGISARSRRRPMRRCPMRRRARKPAGSRTCRRRFPN